MARQDANLGAAAYGMAAPPSMPITALAPGALAKLSAKARARFLKSVPKGLMPTAPMKAAGIPNTVLD